MDIRSFNSNYEVDVVYYNKKITEQLFDKLMDYLGFYVRINDTDCKKVNA